jgi:hypothetical protein
MWSHPTDDNMVVFDRWEKKHKQHLPQDTGYGGVEYVE